MGRIAEALKRAERERRMSLGIPGAEVESTVSTAVAAPPAPSTSTSALDSALASEPSVAVAEVPGKAEPPPGEKEVSRGLSESLVPFFARSSLVTEQYRSLRTRLLSQNPHYEHRVIAITSAVPREGKSVTSLNLGCILAEIRHLNVLVVDGDFRRSSLARMLNQPDGPGLAEVLRGELSYNEVLRKTPVPNLTFLPAGSTHGHSAAELLTAASARPLFRRMQNDFHYTIVDTPPATTVTDVGIIGQMCSGVVVVVRLQRTDESAAKRCVRLLQVNNIPIIGCLIVGRDAPVGRYGYGYGYSYGYNYYRYYDYYKKGSEEK